MPSAPTRSDSAAATLYTIPAEVPIRLVVWGATEDDVKRAISEASWGWGRLTWEFVEIERHIGVPCPIDVEDPWSIAADRHYDWAYAAFRADR